MVYNSFYINILIRVILFGITNFGFFYLLVSRNRFFSMILLGILIIIQIILLIHYVNSTNRNLARFLLTLGEEDTTFVSLRDKVEKTFRGLHTSFSKLNEEISQMRLDKEYSAIRIEQVVDQVSAGILGWNDSGKIEVINESAKSLLGGTNIKYIDDLNKINPGLLSKVKGIKSGKKAIIHVTNPWGEKQHILFRSTNILLGKNRLNLLSFHDIKAELDEQEVESWQKLIRVLIHEVSNSVTPITTLGTSIRNRISSFLSSGKGESMLSDPMIEDVLKSAELIENRGNGLLEFIQRYKSFIRLPEPKIETVNLNLLLDDVCSLCSPMIKDSPTRLTCQAISENLQIYVDRKMIEQVLINLIQNAIEALTEKQDGEIRLSARSIRDKIEVDITDNGEGIPDESIDKIFIPFYTTKEKGSGIGLSLCRRILILHGGTIRINSKEQKGTTVTLSFPQ